MLTVGDEKVKLIDRPVFIVWLSDGGWKMGTIEEHFVSRAAARVALKGGLCWHAVLHRNLLAASYTASATYH